MKVPKGLTEVRVDTHLYSNHSSGRATSRRVDPKVPRVGTESLRWIQMSERLGTKSQGSGTKSKGRMRSPKVKGQILKVCASSWRPDTKGFGTQLGGSGIDRGCPEQARD